MEVTSLCLLLSATLNIHPHRSHFFWYEHIALSCETAALTSGNWTVKRNTSSQTFEPCSAGWGIPQGSSCIVQYAYPADSGVYWCESEQGCCSSSLNITIAGGAVIIAAPPLPVTEGDEVTLSCHYREDENGKATSNFSAKYYKNGVFRGTYPTGTMTFTSVSTSDEGFYTCEHPTQGESPQSWMSIRGRAQPPPLPPPPPPVLSVPRLVCIILLIIVYVVLSVVCVTVHRKWARARAEAKRASDQL
ncbi:uncharacterized protein LOC114435760 [Parambassis ranga]|uniref:Uncharacterized protein LOC114435760 n=1 Tax=Parambassis ranga TaxID=210632 RepID=A0A6P7IMB1_9TELE|nr:uncharacterized protein LOC114435760 [Parambassis ranga]